MKILDNFISNLKVAIYYLKFDLIKKQRDFKIGLIAVFLVVFFITLLLNAIQYTPTIFIKLTEETQSEIDLILTPDLSSNLKSEESNFDSYFYQKKKIVYNTSKFNFTNFHFLNLYDIKEKLSNLSFIEGITPRWLILGKTSNINENISNEFKTNILILDSSIENDIGVGRSLNVPELKKNECYISRTLASALKVKEGDIIQMGISLYDIVKTIFIEFVFNDQKSFLDSLYSSIGYNEESYNRIKRNGFYGDLRDDYEKDEDFNSENSKVKDSKIKIPDFNIFDENKFKNIKNDILNSEPIKRTVYSLANEYLNSYILNNINKTLNIANQFLPIKISLNDLKTFSIRRSYLKDPLFKNIPFIDEFNKLLFEDDKKKENSQKFDMEYITRQIIRRVIKYNKKTDIISFDKKILDSLITGNITNLLEEIEFKKYYEKFVEEELYFENITKLINIKLNLTIISTIKSTGGKWPSGSGNVLAIDSKHIKDYLYLNSKNILEEIFNSIPIETLNNRIKNNVEKFIKDLDLNKYCLTVNIILKNKFEIYKKDIKDMRYHFARISDSIFRALGVDFKAIMKAPLYTNIIGYEKLKIFLEHIFFGIMFFLWIISVLLVYSLMLGNIDERTYEFGMMRSLGYKKNNLIYLIILKGISFAIPGIILGLASSYILNNFISFLFNSFCGLVMPFFLSKENIIFGIITGFSIPLISSYFPIKKCLNIILRDSLTLFNNKKMGDIAVSMIKLEKMGVSPTGLVASLTLIIIGLFTYYLCPLSYFLNNLSLFLFIMICILIILFVGIIILSTLVIPYLQNIILKISMYFTIKDNKFHLLILKNLEGHKRRNRKVSIIFIISLGFTIFAGCTLNLVVDNVEHIFKNLIGGDFSIIILNKNHLNLTLNQILINSYLDNITKYYPNLIESYSYYSFEFDNILDDIDNHINIKFGSLNGHPSMYNDICGIDKNFLDSTYNSYYYLAEYDKKLNISYTKNNKIDIIKMMYDNPNIENIIPEKKSNYITFPRNEKQKNLKNIQINIFMPYGLKKMMGIDLENPASLIISSSSKKYSEYKIPVKIIGILKKLPGFIAFSSYKNLASLSSLFISLEQMKELIEIVSKHFNIKSNYLTNATVDGIRKKRLILKYKDNASKELKEMVFYGMKNYIEDLNVYSFQLHEIMDTTFKVKNIIEIILLILGIIALILSFFLIWISFYNNIRENIAEYGIMRSIGITKAQSIRIYLYEAFVIILSSIIIGTILGIFISTTITVQFDMFFEFPFIFHFPFKLYSILITIGLFLALLGSYYPTYAVNSISLVKIMKGFID